MCVCVCVFVLMLMKKICVSTSTSIFVPTKKQTYISMLAVSEQHQSEVAHLVSPVLPESIDREIVS